MTVVQRPVRVDPLEHIRAQVVVDENGCWLWQGYVHPTTGYGYVRRCVLVHREVVELLHGPIPPLMTVDHVYERGCRSRSCCAPDHLEVVSLAENTLRAARRRATGVCPSGHTKQLGKKCPQCNREAVARHRERNRAHYV